MRASAACVLLAGIALVLGAGCGGSTGEPFRIGILADCYGPFSSLHELIVASAELPLLERGGTLRGKVPSAGVRGAQAAGRPVELLYGCVHSNDEVLPEARRLVEEDGADLLVGPLDPQEGLVLREYARRRPKTTFLIEPSSAPELTLTDPAHNVFRFVADSAQTTAGLGSYAYRELGWRTAAAIADDIPYGWENASGFIAEFCALGGRVVERRWIPVGTDPAEVAGHIPSSVDGVYLGTALAPTLGFVKRYSAHHRDLARHLVANAVLLTDPQVVPLVGGVVVGGNLPFEPTPAAAGYLAAFAKAFPGIPGVAALNPLAVPYRDGVEAALGALEKTDGSSDRRFLEALARIELDSPSGRMRLDRDRQAVVANYLSRVVTDAKGKPSIRTLKVVPGVEQTFGGYFKASDPPPSRTTPACVKRTPPPWAR